MGVNGKFDRITRADLLAVADRFGVGTASKILRQIGQAISAWPDFAQPAGLSATEMDGIREHHAKMTN
jgi:serine/threonine-protein kinase HipA